MGARFFISLLGFDIVMLLAGGADSLVLLRDADALLHSLFAGISDLAYFLVLASFLLYLAAYAAGRGPISLWPTRIGVAIACAYGVLWFVSDFTGIIYVQDETGTVPGPLYWVGQVGGYLVGILALYTTLRYRRHFQTIELLSFLLFVFVPLIGSLFRPLVSDITLMPILITLSVVVIKTFVQLGQDRLLEQQMAENANLRFNVAVSQIRPHFIYNALTAIRSLCDMDSEAYLAVTSFSGFLRGSLDVLESRECIPFETELETVRNYLYIEQLRFQNKISVVWDIRDKDFNLPACSLQVLVENAVRHGIRGSEGGSGELRIRTEARDGCHVVRVEDDGDGFDPESIAGLVGAAGVLRPSTVAERGEGAARQGGVGLKSLAQRLATMCDGRLEIDSAPGRGCRATILIVEGGSYEHTARR